MFNSFRKFSEKSITNFVIFWYIIIVNLNHQNISKVGANNDYVYKKKMATIIDYFNVCINYSFINK